MILEEITIQELKNLEPEIGILPVGSTEQHGKHAPYKTDSLIATEIAKTASEKTDTLLLPTVSVSISKEHSNFKGTLHVSQNTLQDYIEDIIKSASESSIEKFIIVSGHGGNRGFIRGTCLNLYHEHNIQL